MASSSRGLPTSALSEVGVPSATIRPGADDPDAVGELIGLLEVLGGQEDRRALVVELLDLLPDRLAADRVEAGGRLVEEEDARARGRAPRRGRGAASSRPSRCRRGGRRPGSARPGAAARPPRPLPSRAIEAVQGGLEADQLARRSSAGRAPPPGGRRRSTRRTARGLLDDVVAGDPGACRRSAAAAWSASGPSSSCRRRWGRGTRRSRPRRPRGRPRRRPGPPPRRPAASCRPRSRARPFSLCGARRIRASRCLDFAAAHDRCGPQPRATSACWS